MKHRDDTESGERAKIDLKLSVDAPPARETRVGLFDHTEPYGSRIPDPVGTPGPDAPTPAAAPEAKKVFNPWKFGRTTLPPGLRRELILAELPDSPTFDETDPDEALAQPSAPQLANPVDGETKTKAQSDAAPPTTLRTERKRSRVQQRNLLWFIAPLLALCFVGGAVVSVLTKRPNASTPTRVEASRPAAQRTELPTKALNSDQSEPSTSSSIDTPRGAAAASATQESAKTAPRTTLARESAAQVGGTASRPRATASAPGASAAKGARAVNEAASSTVTPSAPTEPAASAKAAPAATPDPNNVFDAPMRPLAPKPGTP